MPATLRQQLQWSRQAWPAPTKRLSPLQATLPGFNYLSLLFRYPIHLHYFNSLIKESP